MKQLKSLKAMCLILCLSVILCLAPACSTGTDGGETPVTDTALSQTPEPVASEQASEPAAPEQAAPESPPEETAAEDEVTEPEPEPVPVVSLPIMDDMTTYTIWMTMHPAYVNLVENPADLSVWSEIADRTNITFDFTAVNGMAETEQFNLMTATNDYTDVICRMRNYTTGIESAIDDEVVIDLYDLLEEYCPTYWSIVSSDPTTFLTLVTESGKMGTIAALYTDFGTNEINGTLIRKDWLDEFGLDVPETFDELHTYLTMAHDNYGAAMEFNNSGNDIALSAGLNISAGGFTVVDGVVKASYLEDVYYDYLSRVAQWYSEGLIYPDFYTFSDITQNASMFANDQYSYAGGMTTSIGRIMSFVTNPDSTIEMYPMTHATENKGDVVHVGQVNTLIKEYDCWAISTACNDPVPLLKLVEYMFSDEGQLLFNYGIEGLSYEIDADGNPQWIDFIINNPDARFDAQLYLYAFASIPSVYDCTKEFYNYSEVEWLSMEVFGSQTDGAYNYPDYAVMTADEESEYAQLETDVSTYIESEILKFILGQTELTKEGWAACVDQMVALGLNDMVKIRQDSYDRSQKLYKDLMG